MIILRWHPASTKIKRPSRGDSYRALVARIGFIGVGRMGQRMRANLVGAGYQVTAGDVRAELESMVTGYGGPVGGPASCAGGGGRRAHHDAAWPG